VDKLADYTIARVDDKPAAFAMMKPDIFGYPFVELLVVSEVYRRHGIGLVLMEFLFDHCKADRLFASTNESSAPMRRLLDKAGFTQCGYCDVLGEGDSELFYVSKES
jgi:GNAT superfamily N-acetyltransferase